MLSEGEVCGEVGTGEAPCPVRGPLIVRVKWERDTGRKCLVCSPPCPPRRLHLSCYLFTNPFSGFCWLCALSDSTALALRSPDMPHGYLVLSCSLKAQFVFLYSVALPSSVDCCFYPRSNLAGHPAIKVHPAEHRVPAQFQSQL